MRDELDVAFQIKFLHLGSTLGRCFVVVTMNISIHKTWENLPLRPIFAE
jgi:hypothetical protein